MTEPHGPHYGPWLAIGLAVPLTALVFVMSRTWDRLSTFAVIAAVTAVALQRARLSAALHWHSTQNRIIRDDARTIEAQARPLALADEGGRGELWRAQADKARIEAEVLRAGRGAEREPIPVRVWTDGNDEDGGGYGHE